jgi:hypothetical protein
VKPSIVSQRVLPGVLLAVVVALLPLTPDARGEDWRPVAAGVDYRVFDLPGPTQAHVARLDTHEPSVIIESSIAGGGVSGGFETVSEMARRYDGSLTAWGGQWGPRGRVLVAINGSSFDPETSEPYGGLFHSGEYSLRYGDLAGGTGFVWTDDRQGLIRGCVDHPIVDQIVTRLRDGATYAIRQINEPLDRNGVAVFTPQFGAATPSRDSATEIVIQLDRPLGIAPAPQVVPGTVIDVRKGQGETPLLFDTVVLAARGSVATRFLREIEPGDTIGFSQRIRDLGFGCKRQDSFDWSRVYSGIGGGFVFLRDGKTQKSDDSGATHRDPRTAICLDDRYVFFVVVDGRENTLSQGMTFGELADFCRSELDATWGVNQDGGGSSTMVVNGKVVNTPSDGHERGVANGLMMMAIEPAANSHRFGSRYTVQSPSGGPLLTGPDPRFPALANVEPGETFQILPTAAGLSGVFDDGSFWWKVDHQGTQGWVQEQMLVAGDRALSTFALPPPTRAVVDDSTQP